MRIAHFIHRYPPALGGSEAYFARLGRFLAAQGDHVTVFASNALDLESFWSPRAATVAAGVATEGDIEVRRYRLLRWPGRRWFLKPLSMIPWRLGQCLTLPCNPICPGMWRDAGRLQRGFDVVHASAFPYAFPIVCARRLARRLGVPFFVTPFLHLGDPADPNDPTRQSYLASPFIWLLRESDGVFVQTPSERASVLGLGIPNERIILQGLGVDPAECTGGDRAAARQGWAVGEEHVVIGHLANLSYEKGSVDLLTAFEELCRRSVRPHLVLAGPEMGSFRAVWEKMQWRLDPETRARIHLTGPLNPQKKRDFFAGIDVFALPSRSDSFGLVLLEAWANQKPVIAYRAGGIADVVHHERDGLLTACGDLGALAQALEALCRSADLRRQYGETGQARIETEFRWEEKLELVRAAYDRTLNPPCAKK